MSHQLLGISGSLRQGSSTAAVLRGVQDTIKGRAVLDIFSLADIPLYNQDNDGDKIPLSVSLFKQKISECEGLVIVSAEYNYGIPGVLKNALDWASRPGYESVLKGKPVIFITSSPAATGGVRAHPQLRETLSACLSVLIPGPELAIAAVDKKITDGKLSDEPTLKLINTNIDGLLKWIESSKQLVK